jgi:hypothetical protein
MSVPLNTFLSARKPWLDLYALIFIVANIILFFCFYRFILKKTSS